jgi:hypothetical protein
MLRWYYVTGAVWTTPEGPDDGGECVAMRASNSNILPTERDKNLRLCSAAPQLLEALRDLTASCKNWAPTIDRSRADAAIRLAEQGQ